MEENNEKTTEKMDESYSEKDSPIESKEPMKHSKENKDHVKHHDKETKVHHPHDKESKEHKNLEKGTINHDKKEHTHHETHKVAEREDKKNPSFNFEMISLLLISIFLILVLFNQFQIMQINSDISKKELEILQSNKPAQVELIVISDEACDKCYKISSLVDSIKSDSKINITSVKTLSFSSSEAKELASKNGIESFPTVVLTGEIDKAHSGLQMLSKHENILYLANVPAPYYNVQTGELRGLIKLTIIKPTSCEKCQDLSLFGNQLIASGIYVDSQQTFDESSSEGKSLISKYKLGTLPSVIVSGDASSYPALVQTWPSIGTVESDGSYILRNIPAPFYNLTTKKVDGLISLVLLADKSCETCYNVTIHEQILKQGYSISPQKVEIVDISSTEGKALISKYKIISVPTVLISKEAKYYPNLMSVWSSVGSFEEDETLIFRDFNAFKGYAYKDLVTGEVIPNTAS